MTDAPEQPGTVRPTGHRVLAIAASIGLLGGWSARLVPLRTGRAEPDVSLSAVLLLLLATAILATTAALTRRVVRRERSRLAHHRAVNRLLLGKASAVVGALLLGGYLGYAVAQLGVENPAATTRLWRSALAALSAAAMTAAALFLEHACRIPRHEDESPR